MTTIRCYSEKDAEILYDILNQCRGISFKIGYDEWVGFNIDTWKKESYKEPVYAGLKKVEVGEVNGIWEVYLTFY